MEYAFLHENKQAYPFGYKRWEEIAVSMNYTTANVFLLHGKALREIHVPA